MDSKPTDELTRDAVISAYRRWAGIYDAVFGLVFAAGRRHAARIINARGGRLLEVGVGTGISLPDYGPNIRVVGIDLSPDMLGKARERVARQGLKNVEGLHEMDATALAFPDTSFDMAAAMYVITVTPEPERVLDEMARVVKPGGEIFLVNHFAADKGLRRRFEEAFASHVARLGWRPDFPKTRVLAHPGLKLVQEVALQPLGFFTLLRFKKEGVALREDGAAAAA